MKPAQMEWSHHTEEETHKASAEGSTYTYVKDWDSLDAEQRADADSKGILSQ